MLISTSLRTVPHFGCWATPGKTSATSWCGPHQVSLTDCQHDGLRLSRQPVVVEQVEAAFRLPVGEQLPLEAEEDTEVALAAHDPDGKSRRLQVGTHLRGERGWGRQRT